MSYLGAFVNEICIAPLSAGGYHFRTDDNDDGAGYVNHVIPAGYYWPDTLRNAILLLIQTDIPTARIAISSTGHWTIDRPATGTGMRLQFNELWLRDFLGFHSLTTLTGAETYTGSRRQRGAWRPDKPVALYDPQPFAAGGASQEFAASGAAASEACGEEPDATGFEFSAIDNVTEYTSPAGSSGTSYAGAGVTDFLHARDLWWKLKDSNDRIVQGWRNGRPVRWYPDRDDSDVVLGDAAVIHSTGFTTWIFDGLQDWGKVATPTRRRMSILYDLAWNAREFVDPEA